MHLHALYFMCHCTEYYILSALQVRISEENTLNATTQQLIIAKISTSRNKGVKHTHHYVRAIYNCEIRLR